MRAARSGHRGLHAPHALLPALVLAAAALLSSYCPLLAADDEFTRDHMDRALVVGVKVAPPFVMKDAEGRWTGIGIELWQHIAHDIDRPFRFVEETNVPALLQKTRTGEIDVAVAALTVTADREQYVDFSQPFYVSGLSVAVPIESAISWTPILRTLTSFGFLQAVLALVGLALMTGVSVWLFERRTNEDFAGNTKGLASSVWWSTQAMTQRTSAGSGPRTLPGRVIAVIWTVTSIIMLAVFTASVTSVLTMKQLQKNVGGVRDLSDVRVGTVDGTAVVDSLVRMNVGYVGYRTPREGLDALARGELDAFVYDRPLLAWQIKQHHPVAIKLLDSLFETQNYAFAVPVGSPLRKPISIAVLKAVQTEWWEQVRHRYLGNG